MYDVANPSGGWLWWMMCVDGERGMGDGAGFASANLKLPFFFFGGLSCLPSTAAANLCLQPAVATLTGPENPGPEARALRCCMPEWSETRRGGLPARYLASRLLFLALQTTVQSHRPIRKAQREGEKKPKRSISAPRQPGVQVSPSTSRLSYLPHL